MKTFLTCTPYVFLPLLSVINVLQAAQAQRPDSESQNSLSSPKSWLHSTPQHKRNCLCCKQAWKSTRVMVHLDKGFTTRTSAIFQIRPAQVEDSLCQIFPSKSPTKASLLWQWSFCRYISLSCSPLSSPSEANKTGLCLQSLLRCRKWSVLTGVVNWRNESTGCCLHALLISLWRFHKF